MWIACRNMKSAKVLAPHICGCLLSPALAFYNVLTRSDSVISVSFISVVAALRGLIYSVGSNVASTESGASCDSPNFRRHVGSEREGFQIYFQ